VGAGIMASGVPREEIFVTSKLWATYMNRVEEGVDLSLKNLGLDYLDRAFFPPVVYDRIKYQSYTSSLLDPLASTP